MALNRCTATALALFVAGILCGTGHSLADTPDAINQAELGAKSVRAKNGFDPVLVKAQVLLDRSRFSPGEIDGRSGENFKKAVAAFQTAQGLNANGMLDREVWDKLTAAASDGPALIEYTLADLDVKGPFLKKLPTKLDRLQDLDHLGYTSAREGLAEKFHMSQTLLKELNPGKSFDKIGETIVVANVKDGSPLARASKVEVDKAHRILRAFANDGQMLAVFPASIGSAEKPAPSGRYKVTSVSRNPTYRYNPEYRFKGVASRKPFTIKPGPNNPVGSVWINLSLKGYGIHGTPDPDKVGKTESHGCIRLTNWDAGRLASMIEKESTVDFLDSSPDYDAWAMDSRRPRSNRSKGH